MLRAMESFYSLPGSWRKGTKKEIHGFTQSFSTIQKCHPLAPQIQSFVYWQHAGHSRANVVSAPLWQQNLGSSNSFYPNKAAVGVLIQRRTCFSSRTSSYICIGWSKLNIKAKRWVGLMQKDILPRQWLISSVMEDWLYMQLHTHSKGYICSYTHMNT